MLDEKRKSNTGGSADTDGSANIVFEGVGVDESGKRRFLRIRCGKRTSLLSVTKLSAGSREEFGRLEEIGAPLIQRSAQNVFLNRAQIEANKNPTFKVATKIGMRDNVFVLPYGAFPRGLSDVELYFDERHEDVHRKFQCAGTDEGLSEFFKLSACNTRLIAGFALALSGPVCAAFGLEPPGLQFVGVGGTGKSPAAAFVSSIWGWDTSPGAMLGCGSTWNAKPDAIEVIAAGCNQTLIYLDEMTSASKDVVDAVMRTIQGHGKARYTELHRLIWCTPLLSTSNTSIVAILKRLGGGYDVAAYVDRLIDIPLPRGCDIYFENLHGYGDIGAYCEKMRDLAKHNHGRAGRIFAASFVSGLSDDPAELESYVRARRDFYIKKAQRIAAGGRSLTRIHARFATIYAAGMLGIAYSLFPFTSKELLDALLSCERDHVDFIAAEMGDRSSGAFTAPASSEDRLERYIHENLDRFIEVDHKAGDRLGAHDQDGSVGYVGTHDGEKEIWLSNERFELIAGGKMEATLLKEKLQKQGALLAERRGDKLSYVVKRQIPGLGRPYMVALKKPRGLTKKAI